VRGNISIWGQQGDVFGPLSGYALDHIYITRRWEIYTTLNYWAVYWCSLVGWCAIICFK